MPGLHLSFMSSLFRIHGVFSSFFFVLAHLHFLIFVVCLFSSLGGSREYDGTADSGQRDN